MATGDTNAIRHFDVRTYVIQHDPRVFTNAPAPELSRYTGTNLGLDRIVAAGSEVLLEYQTHGHPKANVSIAQELITNGVVTMHVYEGAFPQVLISGKRLFGPGEAGEAALLSPAATNSTNAAAVVKTNAQPRFSVQGYEVTGNTLLTDDTLTALFSKHTGTNLVVTNIVQAAADLQLEYRRRGYLTVGVTMPPQQLTNGIVRLHVSEGRLSDIVVTGNRFVSSNNVMRALPSLRTNMILVEPVFVAELDRANQSQDRQIYPQLQPGPEPNTTALQLKVVDRLPLHGKVELNNQSSPGTPELRLNSSAVYNNLWQLEHSLGVQYSFSPEVYKQGVGWDFYDRPLVANYSGFYRMPLGGLEAIGDAVASQPGSFGYDEASRKFRLPAPSYSGPELNVYASRSTIDTGVLTTFSGNIYNTNGNSLDRHDEQQDLTVNSGLGARLSLPLRASADFRSGFSGGFDYKSYQLTSHKTNNFILNGQVVDPTTGAAVAPTNFNTSLIQSAVPVTRRAVEYLPLSLRYDASLHDARGTTTIGLGINANSWSSGSPGNMSSITGSDKSSGHYVVLNPSLSRDFVVRTNWVLSVRADGQWASEPLISNEQFGLGGLATVRGYHEGEVFGDNGWHVSLEQKTAPHAVGIVYGGHPLTVRASVYMDYGEVYLIDPQGRNDHTPLWGTGFGGVATLGATWEARFLFSWPLRSAGTTEAFQPRFDFSLSAQF